MSIRITLASSGGWSKVFETNTYKGIKYARETALLAVRNTVKLNDAIEKVEKRLSLLEEKKNLVDDQENQ